jgi:protein-tyrosine-phosphatase
VVLSRDRRTARHAALGDPIRLAIIDELISSDRSPVELRRLTGTESNLLAHHLDVLEQVGLIVRKRSSGDGRRRYVQLQRSGLAELAPTARVSRTPALFVCTHNSARSQLAAALWAALVDEPAESAGTHPAARVHPGAVQAARRAGLDLTSATPRPLDAAAAGRRLVVTVCDRAHEELEPDPSWLHWSIRDPVASPSTAAFDRTVAELRERITTLIDAA